MTVIKFNRTEVKRIALKSIASFTTDRMTNMETCRDFLPEPSPTLEEMGVLRDNFQSKESTYKANGSELNKQARDAAFDALVNGHIDWIEYAEPIIGSNEDRAALFGYPQYAKRKSAEVPQGVPPKPTFELTVNPGEIILYAKAYKQGAKTIYYNWQVSADGGTTYSYLPGPNGSYRRKIKLEYSKAYKFKVAYATTAGEGAYSEELDVTLTKDMVKKETKKAA